MSVLPKVRTALCIGSQLPGVGPTDVEDVPACSSKHGDDDDDDDDCF